MSLPCISVALALLVASLSSAAAEKAARDAAQPVLLFVGTYTHGGSEGIYALRFDPETGALSQPVLAAKTRNPSFLSLAPGGKFLYSIREGGGKPDDSAGVCAFKLEDDSGKLTLLNQQSSEGAGPCHVGIDPSGRHLFVANYGSGHAAVLPVGEDGKLRKATAVVHNDGRGPSPRQEGPHAHEVVMDPAGQFLFVPDLGLDKVFVYRLDGATGTLIPADPPSFVSAPGSGPRHIAFHPGGSYAYLVNELASTVTALAYDARDGRLTEIQTIDMLPADFKGRRWAAEIAVHPGGKYLYASNRGHDVIVSFAIDRGTGRLQRLGETPAGGKTTRHFTFDPTGRYLLAAAQDSNVITVFRIDARTGSLTPTGSTAAIESPVCIVFVPSAK